ncbi:hypothetical protein BX666DRAFT_248696 [Dichotomocladium elegans]|nr:hypothetical protein BX666DRAFT_248696 [Dichotomocladium elegans]
MVDVHYYFDHPEGYQRWKEILKEVDDALKEFIDDEEDPTDGPSSMDIDEAVGKMSLEEAMPSRAMDARPILTVRVLIPVDIGDERKEVHVAVDTDIRSIAWLKAKVSKLLWEKYGVEPRISRLHIGDRDLFTYEIVTLVIKPDDIVEAVVDGMCACPCTCDAFSTEIMLLKGFTKKTPLEVYRNACQRLNIPVIANVETILGLEAPSALLLSSIGLSSRDVPALKVVLKQLPFLHTLDLSANLLCTQII